MEELQMSDARRTGARVLAIAGTILAGVPLVAPLVLAAVFVVATGRLRVDYLMPGELFVLVLTGGVVLAVAAVLARRRRVPTFVAAALPAVLFAILALASGSRHALTVGVYALYVAATVALVVTGVILCRDVFRRAGPAGGA